METPPCTSPVKLTDQRFVNLYTTQIERSGKSSSWIFASRKKSPGVIGKIADAAVVVAVLEKDGESFLVLTREFRAPLGTYELSLPSGLIDDGEDAVIAAAREFREETGLTLTGVTHASPPLASSAGLTDETVSLVYGRATGTVSKAFLTEHEDVEVLLMNIRGIGKILEGTTDVISSRLYPVLISMATSGIVSLPQLKP